MGHTLVIQAGLLIWPLRQAFALVEQTSRKLVLGTVLEWFRCSAPEQVREPTKALRERTWCRAGSGRVVPVARLIHDQRPSWGIPSFLMLDFVYQTAPDSEQLGNPSLTLRECTVGYTTDDPHM